MSFGGGTNSGQSRSRTHPGKVWEDQAPYLQQLFAQAQQTAASQRGGQGPLEDITSFSERTSERLIDQANQGSPWLSGQIQGLGEDIGQFFNQQILPGINNEAGGYGQYGGARHSIGQGLAGQDALRQFSRGATELRAGDYANGPARARELYNLGMAPYSAQFQPLQMLAQLLGSPTVLSGGGQSSSWNHAGNFNVGLGGG